MGAKGSCGGSPVFSMTEAPDMTGAWDVVYEDQIGVRVTIGGAVYDAMVVEGGTVTIDHEGTPITFDLDCARPEVICPSETWQDMVSIRQDDPTYPHRIYVNIPKQECTGMLVDPDPAECGTGTLNEECEQVCDGEIRTVDREAFGVINEPGDHFDVLLGAGVATNGVNCALLAVSHAGGDLVTSGSATGMDWEASSVSDGVVTIAYAGGCLWAGDPDDDGTLEALVIGASLEFTVGFTAQKVTR
jgi:hypothetical protein